MDMYMSIRRAWLPQEIDASLEYQKGVPGRRTFKAWQGEVS
jgi:hypothetical protein